MRGSCRGRPIKLRAVVFNRVRAVVRDQRTNTRGLCLPNHDVGNVRRIRHICRVSQLRASRVRKFARLGKSVVVQPGPRVALCVGICQPIQPGVLEEPRDEVQHKQKHAPTRRRWCGVHAEPPKQERVDGRMHVGRIRGNVINSENTPAILAVPRNCLSDGPRVKRVHPGFGNGTQCGTERGICNDVALDGRRATRCIHRRKHGILQNVCAAARNCIRKRRRHAVATRCQRRRGTNEFAPGQASVSSVCQLKSTQLSRHGDGKAAILGERGIGFVHILRSGGGRNLTKVNNFDARCIADDHKTSPSNSRREGMDNANAQKRGNGSIHSRAAVCEYPRTNAGAGLMVSSNNAVLERADSGHGGGENRRQLPGIPVCKEIYNGATHAGRSNGDEAEGQSPRRTGRHFVVWRRRAHAALGSA
eukprot:Opistho-2@4824